MNVTAAGPLLSLLLGARVLCVACAAMCVFSPPARAQVPAVRETLLIREKLVGPKRHGRFAALEVRCEATVRTPGAYEVDPVLQCTCGPLVVPGTVYGSIHDVSAAGARPNAIRAVVGSDSLGVLRFTVTFPADEVARLEADGPWTVCCRFLYLDRTQPEMRRPPQGSWIESNLAAATRKWKRRSFSAR